MRNTNDTFRNRTRDLPACSAVPEAPAPSSVPTVAPLVTKCAFFYITRKSIVVHNSLPFVLTSRPAELFLSATRTYVARGVFQNEKKFGLAPAKPIQNVEAVLKICELDIYDRLRYLAGSSCGKCGYHSDAVACAVKNPEGE